MFVHPLIFAMQYWAMFCSLFCVYLKIGLFFLWFTHAYNEYWQQISLKSFHNNSVDLGIHWMWFPYKVSTQMKTKEHCCTISLCFHNGFVCGIRLFCWIFYFQMKMFTENIFWFEKIVYCFGAPHVQSSFIWENNRHNTTWKT